MLDICLKQNYFQFNNNKYIDNNSLAMGNPLSPLAAKIFLDNLENDIQKHTVFNKFLFWYSFVEDILSWFVGAKRQ